MSQIDAVIFDLGNVLVRVDETAATTRFAARTGKTPQEVEHYLRSTPHAVKLALGKLTGRGFYRIVAKDMRFDGDFEEFAMMWSDIFTPIEPMVALAESLKAKLPRLILSNTNAIHMDYIYQHFAFLEEFDGHVLSYEVGLLKPDESIYRLALKQWGLTAERTVFIDDLTANVDGARVVGMQAIRFEDADQVRRELTKLGVAHI